MNLSLFPFNPSGASLSLMVLCHIYIWDLSDILHVMGECQKGEKVGAMTTDEKLYAPDPQFD